MVIEDLFYPSDLIPAAPVKHGYRNFWVRDGYFIGICCGGAVQSRLWNGMTSILDRYKWKLEIHARKAPVLWYEDIHIRYDENGMEIPNEHWMHNQVDSHGNFLEVAVDQRRSDLAELLVDHLDLVKYQKRKAAGVWEDRNSCDSYSIAACLYALQKSKRLLEHKYRQIDNMVKRGTKRLYSLLPYATEHRQVCLSQLGTIFPYNMAGPYRQEIIDIVCANLKREPFGFIRYHGDSYDGEGFTRGRGTEMPWLLGDCFMALIEPENPEWRRRLDRAYEHFGCIPEAYYPENMKMNRNSPLVWAESMYRKIRSNG
jgi:phosphorylase kinase alpha/beta subunit